MNDQGKIIKIPEYAFLCGSGEVGCDPKVSIIVPVYNAGQYIERCLKSVYTQTYSNFEVLLIDDGSMDQSGAICDRYAGKDHRFCVIHQKNQGVSAARNKGLELAKGEYIVFIDADDFVVPEMLEKAVGKILQTNADMVVFNAKFYGAKRKPVGWNIEKEGYSTDAIKLRLMTGDSYLWRKLYKRSIWDQIRFPVGGRYEDAYVNIEVLHRTKSIALLPETLYFYESGEHGSIVQTKSLSNRYHAMTAWIHTLSAMQACRDWEEVKQVAYYYAIAAWDEWAYLSLKAGNHNSLLLEKRVSFDPSYKMGRLNPEQIQFECYVMRALAVYEKSLLYRKNGFDNSYELKDLIRQLGRALCVYYILPDKTDKESTLLTKLEMINTKTLNLSVKQKILWFMNRSFERLIYKIKGNRLLKKGI